VQGIVSDQDFAKVSLPGPFDLIWSGSLLTHLNEPRSTELLRLYHRNLTPVGLCVFSTHGLTSAAWLRTGTETYGLTEAARLKALSEFENRGYGYADYELVNNYGISIATRARILEMALAVGDWSLSSYFERGWMDQHDVYGLTKAPTKAPLIIEAREPEPPLSTLWRWTL
jgi:hypothetical protein